MTNRNLDQYKQLHHDAPKRGRPYRPSSLTQALLRSLRDPLEGSRIGPNWPTIYMFEANRSNNLPLLTASPLDKILHALKDAASDLVWRMKAPLVVWRLHPRKPLRAMLSRIPTRRSLLAARMADNRILEGRAAHQRASLGDTRLPQVSNLEDSFSLTSNIYIRPDSSALANEESGPCSRTNRRAAEAACQS